MADARSSAAAQAASYRDLISIANKLAVEPEFGAIGGMSAALSPIDPIPDETIQELIRDLESGLDMNDKASVDAASWLLCTREMARYLRHKFRARSHL